MERNKAIFNSVVYFVLAGVTAGMWMLLLLMATIVVQGEAHGQVLETPAYPTEVIPAPPVIDPSTLTNQERLTLRRLKVCNVDYAYCAGNLLKEQASYAAAAKLNERCGGAVSTTGPLLDLLALPIFDDISACQMHKSACGYTLWYSGAAARAMQQNATLQCVAYKK